jgi:hypothetical protein
MTTPITGETWGDEVDKVREVLLQEAEQPFAALRPKLDAARRELLAAIEGVSEEQAQLRPAAGEGEDAWGIAEVLRHFASIETIMAGRIQALGSGEATDSITPTYPGYMEAIETRRLPELRAALDASYAALLAAIDAIEGHERLDTVAAHRRFGELNCRSWIAMHTLHLQDHTRQIGKIKTTFGNKQI